MIMLQDPEFSPAYLVVDALDEFDRTTPGLDELIQLISTSLVLSEKVKWLLSSRPEIDLLTEGENSNADTLDASKALVELDTERLASPVEAYIQHKLCSLKSELKYDDSIIAQVSNIVRSRANDNFLWVFFVLKEVKSVRGKYAVQALVFLWSFFAEN